MAKLLRRAIVILASCLTLAIVLFAAHAAWLHYKYPYGPSQCCLRMILMAMRPYADDNDGRYPAGLATPEASLSLLYRGGYEYPYNLRGKTVPEKVVRDMLENGGLLGPDTCGWHYVEGLTLLDSSDIAIIWDKIGLGHNGQRLPAGGHEVGFVDLHLEVIPAKDWDRFLAEQRDLVARRTPRAIQGGPSLVANVQFPDGTITDHYDGSYTLYTELPGRTDLWLGPQSGSQLTRDCLTWYLDQNWNGPATYTLAFGKLVSDRVTVQYHDGIATPRTILFPMHPRGPDEKLPPANPPR